MPVIKVKLFSHLKYAFKMDELEIRFCQGDTTQDLESKVRQLGGQKIASIPFRIAVNHEFISEATELNESDEIALIPPVQGG